MSILKANHNEGTSLNYTATVVSNIVNVHFESKPQHEVVDQKAYTRCVKYR